jgi:hypothetical protein
VVERGCPESHEDLALARHGIRHLLDDDDLGTAVLVDATILS